MLLMLAVLALSSQDTPPTPDALFQNCDRAIPWISDGSRLVENETRGRILSYEHDRDPYLDRAMALAAERKRLILWYCPRVPGPHMYRVRLLDEYMKVVAFTDPGVVDLITAKFVPLRACCDENLSTRTGIKRFDFVEPGFVLLTPDGKVVHTIDRLRSFNGDWFRAALIGVLRGYPEYNSPAGESTEALIRGGDDEQALPRATPPQKALIHRRAGRFDEVMKIDGVPLQKGLALLNQRRLSEARAILEQEPSAEALYGLALIDAWSGRSPERRCRELVDRFPDSPWAWRAASNLVRGPDGMVRGPMSYNFEDCFWNPVPSTISSTRAPSGDVDETVRRAVAFLLRAQREDGSWNDNRYSAWPDRRHVPDVTMVATAMAALALLDWRVQDPERIDAAVRRARAFITDERHRIRDYTNGGGFSNYASYVEAYRLLFLARVGDVPAMNEAVACLGKVQTESGHWYHDYPNPFTTATVVHSLALARKAGADVPETMLRRGAAAVLRGRGPGATFAYNEAREKEGNPSSEKDSMARKTPCELAIYEAGQGDLSQVAAGLHSYWKHYDRYEAVRTCDYHSDGELGGWFYFSESLPACEAAALLPEPARAEQLRKFRTRMLAIPEADGSFIDNHELGKSYGTAFALEILNRCR